MNIVVKLTVDKNSYSENITEKQKQYFKETYKNINDENFDLLVRPISTKATELDSYRNNDINQHFIGTWFDTFIQSDNVPMWIYEAEEIIIDVLNEQ